MSLGSPVSLLAAVGPHQSAPPERHRSGWARSADFLRLSCLTCSVVFVPPNICSCRRSPARLAASLRDGMGCRHRQDRRRVRPHSALVTQLPVLHHAARQDADPEEQHHLKQGSG